LGLIAYPSLLEPRFTLGRQSKLWTLGYFLVVALVALCAFTVRRSGNTRAQRAIDKNRPASDAAPDAIDERQAAKNDRRLTNEGEPLTLRRRMRWVALAFVPSSLMLGVTTYIFADDRPQAAHLAEFYLWLSTGGALGGLFNALLAPAIFNSVIEYPLMILLACLLLPRENWQDERASARRLDLALPVGIGLLTLG